MTAAAAPSRPAARAGTQLHPALPPGPPLPQPLALLGWRTRPIPLLERARARYGDVFTLRVEPGRPWVMLADPAHVREVFTGDPALFHAGEANAILRPVLGAKSVLLLDDAPHLAQRRLLLPPFHGERMQRYGDLMREVAERELERWPAGAPMTLLPAMQAVTLEIIVRAVFGVRAGEDLGGLREALRDLLEWLVQPWQMLFVGMLGERRAEQIKPLLPDRLGRTDELLHELIAQRRTATDLGERDDILSLLLQARHEDGSPLSDEELRDELMTLLVAGHETTATALSWGVERLVRTPHALMRLTEEVDAGGHEYLDATVQETLRLRPVLPAVVRRLTADARVAGHDLPRGAVVAPCIALIHRRPDVYPEPHAFRPERFLDRPPGTYSWLPFGGGVRRCLGATFAQFEMATVLAAMVRRLHLRPERPEGERIARRAITLVPGAGTRVVTTPRA